MRIVLTILAAVVLAACGCDRKPEAAPPQPPASHDAALFRFDYFRSVTSLEGETVRLNSLVGKVVLLDLFGTWCQPCRRTAPVLVSVYERFHEQGLEAIGLAYEEGADAAQATAAVEAFAAEFKVPYVLALGPEAVWEELDENGGIARSVPVLLLLDRRGFVREVFNGLAPGEEAVLAEHIERLLAEPYVPPAAEKE